jgi:phosphoglycerol transferase
MRGRAGDRLIHAISELEPQQLVEAAAGAGFGGIWIDRDGYPGDGTSMRAALRAVLDVEPLVSDDGRFAFFDLAGYLQRTHAGGSSAESAARQDLLLHPLTITWDNGCYALEHDSDRPFRWCSGQGEIRVDNDTAVRRTVSLRMSLVAAQPPARLKFEGDLWSDEFDLVGMVPVSHPIEIPPGRHSIRFACDGHQAEAPGDPRNLVFRVEDFALEESLPASQRR